MESVDPVAGVILSDSLSAAKAVAESRMLNRRRGDSSFSSWWGRQVVALPFHCSWAAVLVALDGDASPTVADSRLLVLLPTGPASRRPRRRTLVSARRWVVVLALRRLGAAAGIILHGGRVEELLNSLRHYAALFAFEVVELVCRRLGGTDILCGRGIHRAISPEEVGDCRAALSDRA